MAVNVTFPNRDSLKRPQPIAEEPASELTAQLREHKLTDSEYDTLKSILGRVPTRAELGIFSSMWSEHCSYKSSRTHLKRFPTEGSQVVVGPGENAGVVRLEGRLCLAFKMESHNHPSYIEPYQGAATGVGGILRDVFCMGARPVANLNSLRFGRREHPRTAYLVEHVVKGIGDYGNCVGVPTVGGQIAFDGSYDENCLVNAMTVGLIREDRIFKGYASGAGNWVVYVGSATGRDGIHGATMASAQFASDEDSSRTTVQVGDPFTEKLLLEATLEVLDRGLVIGLQDMGAAGLTSSSFEMASRAGNGLFLDLDRVPTRTEAMSAYELLLSESQERMLMVIKPENWDALKEVLDRWELSSAVIGEVTDTGQVEIHHQGRLEAEVPVGPITDAAPSYERPLKARPAPAGEAEAESRFAEAARTFGMAELLTEMLRDTGSKLPVYDQYDHHIGTRTVRGPEDGGAAVLWVRDSEEAADHPHLGVAIASGCRERMCRVDPRQGAAETVYRTARMIFATGGKPLAITDCLNFGNPEDPHVMWEFSEAVDGISDACRELGIAVVSGNVSFYNETDGRSIAPTPTIGMVGRVDDVRQTPAAVARDPGRLLLLAPRGARPAVGGGLAAKILGLGERDGAVVAAEAAAEQESANFLRELISEGQLAAVRDVGSGGILTTAAKLAIPHDYGIELDLSAVELGEAPAAVRYFGEIPGCYLLIPAPSVDVETLAKRAQSLTSHTLTEVGAVQAATDVRWSDATVSRQTLARAFGDSLI